MRAATAVPMIQAICRFTFVIGGLLGGITVTRIVDWQNELGLPRYYVIFLLIILGGAIGYVLGGIVGRELTTAWLKSQRRLREVASADLLLGTVGLVVGLSIGLLASTPLRLIKPEWLSVTVTVLLMVTLAYVCASVALSRRKDFVAIFPALAPVKHGGHSGALDPARHERGHRRAFRRSAPPWLHAGQPARSEVRARRTPDAG